MMEEDDKPPEAEGKTLVILDETSGVTEGDLLKLLVEADESEDDVEFIDPKEVDNKIEISKADCVIVPLEEATADLDSIERIVLMAAQAACSIVGVWVPGEEGKGIHPAVATYGRAQIPWDATKLKNVLRTDCPPPYQTPTGTPSKGHDIRPNRCG